MDQFPDTRKSIGDDSGSNRTELNEASWQKWISKGKAQDAVRRKKFFLALWLLLSTGVLLGLWGLAAPR